MTQQHPITPPTELVVQWIEEDENGPGMVSRIAARSAKWGADQELEACRQWLEINGAPRKLIDGLLDARRPKPKSEKQQALEQLDGIRTVFRMSHGGELVCDAILRALKSIPDPS